MEKEIEALRTDGTTREQRGIILTEAIQTENAAREVSGDQEHEGT